ncbi:low choriolytic enzyme isoform X1 [Takifugu rubripes]|nr:low choriolytic enzyme-like isoform X1 [Takifugu rubripes]
MWLLVFICIWTAGCVPINQNQEVRPSVSVGEILNGTLYVESPAAVGEISFNVTQNKTTSTLGSVLVPGFASPETIADFSNELAADEGDILLSENRNALKNVWGDATVPYVIDQSLAHRKTEIQEAFKKISDSSCIRFVSHSTEFSYLKLLGGLGCASYVGCQGGEQKLYFPTSCTVGNLCHEIMHALGLHHEHTREDRDQYVTIEWEHILKGKENNFSIKKGNTLNLPYDLKSIMHYGEFFFSKDGKRTLSPKTSERDIGQREHLSKLDIQRLNKLYHCDERKQER